MIPAGFVIRNVLAECSEAAEKMSSTVQHVVLGSLQRVLSSISPQAVAPAEHLRHRYIDLSQCLVWGCLYLSNVTKLGS